MSILFRFSVLFAGMVGLHNAEEMGLHEACIKETRVENGEEMGLFLPLGYCTIFLHVTRLSTKMTRFNCPVLDSLFKCVEQVVPDFDWEETVTSV
jgi:hypothetical protein